MHCCFATLGAVGNMHIFFIFILQWNKHAILSRNWLCREYALFGPDKTQIWLRQMRFDSDIWAKKWRVKPLRLGRGTSQKWPSIIVMQYCDSLVAFVGKHWSRSQKSYKTAKYYIKWLQTMVLCTRPKECCDPKGIVFTYFWCYWNHLDAFNQQPHIAQKGP